MAAQKEREIVDRLNGEPFGMGLSLVGFDEMEPYELMEVLKKVLVYLDKKHDYDWREKHEQTYQVLAEFLHTLGYQCTFDAEFQQGVMNGDKGTVHPILYWLLINLEALKKRSYLARFCVNLEVPEEFLREEQVFEIFQSYKELQSQFKATHAHVEQERQGRLNPEDLQREVQQLDSEREQLQQKIQHLRQRTDKDEGFQQLLQVTSMLRKEQEEEARLAEKLAEQRFALEQTEQMFVERSARLREMREAQSQDGEGNAEAMLKMLRGEVTKGRDQLGRVRKEIEEKHDQLGRIDQALSEPPVTKGDIDAMEQEIHGMRKEKEDLERKIEEHNQDSRLSVYKQQANLVAKKKEVVMRDKKALEDERDVLSKDLSVKEREYEQMKGHKFMKKDEFKNYAASLRDKSAKFKRLKTELTELRHEVLVLVRTEQLLQARDPTPAGQQETETMIEKVSVNKSEVDKAKGKTLDEITNIVQQIKQKIMEKKNKLAPQIKALRAVRQNFQQVEVKYLEKKGAYDQARASVENDLSKLVGEVKQLDAEALESEQSYHELNMQLQAADRKLQRAHKEGKCLRKEDRHSNEFATLTDCYTSEIKQFEQRSKSLREEKDSLMKNYDNKLMQKKAFVQLQRLMNVKLKVAKQEFNNLGDPRYGMPGAMEERTAGVERLVIDN
jgi:intraflagellar transport protein 81